MDDFDLEIQMGFLDEAKELLTNAEQCFLNLEKAKDDSSVIEQIFRLAHNLKGSAGAVGFSELAEFAHRLESFLLKIKNRDIPVGSEVVTLLLACNDHLCAFVEALRADAKASRPNAQLMQDLQDWIEGRTTASMSSQMEEELSSLADVSIQDAGFTLAAKSDAFAAVAAPAPASVPAPPAVATAKAAPAAKGPAADESIRVSLARIDRLMNNVGELVILQTVMSQQKETFASDLQQHTVGQMDKIIREVQEISMSLRMVPLKQTFQKLQRIVRDTSQAISKEVELEIVGDDTELDKTVLEQIGDPLVHLIRNAVDHGIETPADRVANGKGKVGHVRLSAQHRGSHVVLEIRDDGKGLDAKKLIAKAIEKGILREGAVLTDDEAYRLIFAPGFSTKQEVTDISGRGVGMDVVKTNIDQLGGIVELETELGKGSCFRILLPLTLAIVDGMVIRVGNDRYVVPISQIKQSLQPLKEDVSFVTEVGEVLNLRGETLPVYRIDQLLGGKRGGTGKTAKTQVWEGIALVTAIPNSRAFALLADDILGQQQVVIKRLGEEIHGLPGITGAAILGDGKAALILDFNELIQNVSNKNTGSSNHQTNGRMTA